MFTDLGVEEIFKVALGKTTPAKTWKLVLFTNDVQLFSGITLSSLSLFSGTTSPATISLTPADFTVGTDNSGVYVTFSPSGQVTAIPSSPTTLYGWALVDTGNSILLALEKFREPQSIFSGDVPWTITVEGEWRVT